jgi:hypothetical protein
MFLGGILCNILFPWAPVMFAFHRPGQTLARPYIEGLTHSSREEIASSAEFCCCCCCAYDALGNLPMYMVLQSSFLAYGGLRACNTHSCCLGASCALVDYSRYIQTLQDRVEGENAEATMLFYQQVLVPGNGLWPMI